LASLGGTAAVIGFVSGCSEMLGYLVRMAAGRLASHRQWLWPQIWLGYALNLLSVPGLAVANTWPAGAGFIFTERVGKGVRTPGRDIVLTEAAGEERRGFAFGLHHALDQVGAIAGPIIIAAVLYAGSSYRQAFACMLLPALLALVCLALARVEVRKHEEPPEPFEEAKRLPASFWFFCLSFALLAVGYIDYPLIAYNMHSRAGVAVGMVPLVYAAAMAAEGLMALPLGNAFDKHQFRALRVVALICLPVGPLVFSSNEQIIVLGTLIWGAGMVVQQSLAKAALSRIVEKSQRGLAFGLYGCIYGIAWFLGSTAIGWLYDHNIQWAIWFSVAFEIAGLAVLQLRSLRPAN
jgi:MFS family permease